MGLLQKLKQKSEDNRKREPLTLPVSGETVEIRSMGLGPRGSFLEAAFEKGGKVPRLGVFHKELIRRSTYDPETGNLLFAPGEGVTPQDVEAALDALEPEDGDEIVKVAQKLSALDKDASKDAEKNSGATESFSPDMLSQTDSGSPSESLSTEDSQEGETTTLQAVG